MHAEPKTTSFFVPCACGHELSILPVHAGELLTCECGREVQVPRLSELRQQAGLKAFEASTIDTIHRLIDEGSLPADDFCIISGRPTPDVMDVWIVCEEKWKTGPTGWRWAFVFFGFLFLPFWWLWLLIAHSWLSETIEVRGRDTVVKVPLRVAADQQETVRRSGQRRLRKLLGEVPIYAKLLREYPRARIACRQPASHDRFPGNNG